MYAIVVHGGAGRWEQEVEPALLAGVRHAAETGALILADGGTALDAAVAAVVAMEDDPVFNAGTGAALNIDGEAEMDAGVMVGHGLRTGNVGALKRVRNPVLVARKVMEETDHVLLVGEGAQRFARAFGFPDYDPVTAQRLADYREKFGMLRAGAGRGRLLRLQRLVAGRPDLSKGTVGAVVLDQVGGLAAATSTGGVTLKLAGRVGDTPIPGAGNYATPHAAVSATGWGELMLRCLAAKSVCDLVAGGHGAQEGVDEVIARMAAELGREVGFIAVDARGGVGLGHATASMPHAYLREGQGEAVARMRVQPG
jgi:beta-aspartyl-peptidase (threonine type)